MAEILARGIDVSEWNGSVDFAALRGKIDFAILRCGYGGNYTFQDDGEFEANVGKCQAAGIPWGAYLYSYAQTPAMARDEAAHALRLLRGKRPLYGVWYDLEDDSLPAGDSLTENCIAFGDALEEAGFYCGLYGSLYWMEHRLADPRLDRFDRWVAQWNSTLDYDRPCGMWQYTDRGVLLGKTFDLDYAFRDYPKIITQWEEERDMTQEEVKVLARQVAQQVYQENESRYATLADVPGWARDAVEQVYDELGLAGAETSPDGKLVLDASRSYVRALYVIARVLDRLPAGTEPLEEAGNSAVDKACEVE